MPVPQVFCMTLCLMFVTVCLCTHVCLVIHYLHITSSAITVKCYSLSFSHLLPLSLFLSHLVSLLWPKVREVTVWRIYLLLHMLMQASILGCKDAWCDTNLHATTSHRLVCAYSLSQTQSHFHRNSCTCMHTIVLIKAVGVSKDKCNADI